MKVYHVGRWKGKHRRKTKANSCRGKKKHLTKLSALRHIEALRANNLAIGWFDIYPCKYCTKEVRRGHTAK